MIDIIIILKHHGISYGSNEVYFFIITIFILIALFV